MTQNNYVIPEKEGLFQKHLGKLDINSDLWCGKDCIRSNLYTFMSILKFEASLSISYTKLTTTWCFEAKHYVGNRS